MMLDRLRRLPPLALCAMVALAGGMLGGGTAVHGLHPNGYGPVYAATLKGNSLAPDDISGGEATIADAGCSQCSERDLGYRWATLSAIRSPDQCPGDSWGFRRGCLDYTGGV